MGWIFGVLGAHSDDDARAWRARHGAPAHHVRTPDRYLAAGGPAPVCLAGAFDPGASGTAAGGWAGWIVAGLACVRAADGLVPLDGRAWTARLRLPEPRIADLEGHFVALRHAPGRVEAFTDALGLRTLHVARTDGRVVFGTRLGTVAAAAGAEGVDLAALGPRWLAFNAFTPRSLVHGVERLGPGGRARMTPAGVETSARAWTPSPAPAAPREEDALALLGAGLRPRLPSRRSLGLSGGLDSRLLLALLLGDGDPFALHVFGDDGDPDVRVARRVAAAAARPIDHHPHDVPDADACWARLADYAEDACATTPASTAVRLGAFEALHADGRMVVDGGFGEVARRQFFNRVRRARRPLRADAAPDLFPYFRVPRADVFTPEATAAMEAGAEAELAAALAEMPDAAALGREAFLDLFAVRVRLPYFFGYEQARLDARVAALMPYAQPAFLSAVLALPVSARRDGRLFRRAIHARRPALARIPLVKGGTTYPFRLGLLAAAAFTKIRDRVGTPFVDPLRGRFLACVEDRVRDLARSAAVRDHAPYDAARVVALVDAYYGGDASKAAAVDWWLAYEAWRGTLGG